MTARERAQATLEALAAKAKPIQREAPTKGRVREVTRESWQERQDPEQPVSRYLDFSKTLRLVPEPTNYVESMPLVECLDAAKRDVEAAANALPAAIRLGPRRYLIACPMCPPDKNRHIVSVWNCCGCPAHQRAIKKKRYRTTHPEKARMADAEYRRKHLERARERVRKSYYRHREVYIQRAREYVQKNQERVREYQRVYRARKRAELKAMEQPIVETFTSLSFTTSTNTP